jgi:hypothetical protein
MQVTLAGWRCFTTACMEATDSTGYISVVSHQNGVQQSLLLCMFMFCKIMSLFYLAYKAGHFLSAIILQGNLRLHAMFSWSQSVFSRNGNMTATSRICTRNVPNTDRTSKQCVRLNSDESFLKRLFQTRQQFPNKRTSLGQEFQL